jgi:hypothetical protein
VNHIDFPWSHRICLRSGSEIQSQRQLSGSVATVFRRLDALHNAKGRRCYVCRRRRKVGMIHQVRKRTFKSQPKPFRNLEILCQPRGDCGCPWTHKNPDATVPHGSRWNWIERGEIKHSRSRDSRCCRFRCNQDAEKRRDRRCSGFPDRSSNW